MKAFRIFALFALALLLTSLIGPGVQPVSAAEDGPTFTVNSNGNGADALPGDNVCATLGGLCTLRAAIQEANSNLDTNAIHFNIGGTGIRDIHVLSLPLPAITSRVTLDATTQPGCTAPCVKLDGSSLVSSGAGFYLLSDFSLVKGFIIAGFPDSGVRIEGSSNIVQGNRIGVPAGNEFGIWVQGLNNVIGGRTAGQRNVISGNSSHGIVMGYVDGLITQGTLIQGNYIGTNRAGTAALPNGANGIMIFEQGIGNTIGGTEAGAGNTISGNLWAGIAMAGTNNVIQGNRIGTRADGTGSIGNRSSGVLIYYGAEDNLVGGPSRAAGNRIAHNGRRGVLLRSDAQEANTIRHNSIYANTSLGIDLGVDGVTPNDALDADTGPNYLQNYPVIDRATSGTRRILGRLFSEPNTTYIVEFFTSPAGSCDPLGYGEGKNFLGQQSLTTDASGYVHIAFTSTVAFPAGSIITATATSSLGDTSEFSRCRTAK